MNNKQMNHRYEAVSQPDGSWTVNEFVDGTVIDQTVGSSKRDAHHEAVRLNRHILRDESLARAESSLAL